MPAGRRGAGTFRGLKLRAALGVLAVTLACAGPRAATPNLSADLPSGSEQVCATVVTFVATWCFPCLGHLEILRALHNDLAPRGLAVHAVAMDLEGPRVVQPFAEQAHLPFSVYAASDRVRSGDAAYGKIQGLPTTFVAAPDGTQLLAFEGVAKPEDLRKALEPLLASTPAATGLKRFSCPARSGW